VTEVLAPPRRLKRLFVGRPMQTGQLEETLLSKTLALPIFASDPLSSVAYATESALVVLLAVSAASAHLVFPIAIAIAVLLAIVIVSYMQTVRAYETSGGAYVVARENLGKLPSIVGAAALLTDYVLTVAVSISAGIFAVTSFAPSLAGHKVALSLGCLLIIVLALLITTGFGTLGLWIALRTGSGEGVQSQFPLLFFVLFISSMNLPRNLIEVSWFRDLATINPVSYLIEGLRTLIIEGWNAQALALGFGVAILMVLGALGGASIALRQRMERT